MEHLGRVRDHPGTQHLPAELCGARRGRRHVRKGLSPERGGSGSLQPDIGRVVPGPARSRPLADRHREPRTDRAVGHRRHRAHQLLHRGRDRRRDRSVLASPGRPRGPRGAGSPDHQRGGAPEPVAAQKPAGEPEQSDLRRCDAGAPALLPGQSLRVHGERQQFVRLPAQRLLRRVQPGPGLGLPAPGPALRPHLLPGHATIHRGRYVELRTVPVARLSRNRGNGLLQPRGHFVLRA